jgi:nitrogen fixation/metabolism regulation signal transduction histidine kinase
MPYIIVATTAIFYRIYSVIFILFTVHYYFDTWVQMLIKSCVNYYFSLSFLRKKTLKKYVNMFLAIQSKNKIKFLLQ